MKNKVIIILVFAGIVLLAATFLGLVDSRDIYDDSYFESEADKSTEKTGVSMENENFSDDINGENFDYVLSNEVETGYAGGADYLENDNAGNYGQNSQSINLPVPFTSQAPFENWKEPYKEACEEAVIIMVNYFYQGKELDKFVANSEIISLVNFEKDYFGFYEDSTAEETAQVAREYYGYNNVRVIYNITIEDIKREVALGHPVIVPTAGRLLGNIYFRQPGPYYHMLVVKGYTETEFITNDPGTKRGHDFHYSYEVLYNAIHDFDPLNIYQARKAMIVIGGGLNL